MIKKKALKNMQVHQDIPQEEIPTFTKGRLSGLYTTDPYPPPFASLTSQVGGDHYKTKGIQPVIYSLVNNLDYLEATVVKYVTRWKDRGGIQDLEKAKHYLEILIEYERKGKQGLLSQVSYDNDKPL